MSSTCNSNLERDLLHSESLTSFSNLTNEEKEKKYKYLVKFFYVRGVSTKGAFNNYVDKMRGGGGQKCLILSTLRVWKLSTQGGGQKMAKFWPRSCWMSPLKSTQYIQEACAKYFAVHILKLKRLKTNSVMFFVSFSKFSNFNMWTAKHLAQASCTELTLKMEV